jgi:hypothetical protein
VINSGSAVSSSAIYETAGIQQIVPHGGANTFGGIDASGAGNSYWDCLRDTTGGALTIDNIIKNKNQVEIAGGETSLLVSTFGLQRAAFNQLQAQVRYVEPMNLKGGFSAISVSGMPLVPDRHHPFGKIHFLDEKFLKVFSNRDWHFLDEDGHILKWVTGFDAWEAVLARYLNLGASRRNTQLVMSGLTDSTGY